MAVYVHNITIQQGSTFSVVFQVEGTQTNAPKDLTGYTSSSQLRKTYSSSSAVSFASTITDPIEGAVKISMDSTVTSSLKPGRYVYDVKIENPLEIFRVVEGTALVRPEVTKS